MHFQISLDDIGDFPSQFWQAVTSAKIFAFHGDMGAGKTTIITWLCQYKGVHSSISSPTYSIINEYVYSDNQKEHIIYHIDLYRLKNEEEVIHAGVEDCLSGNAICMIEWPERAPDLFDAATVHIFIQPVSQTVRYVEVKMPFAF